MRLVSGSCLSESVDIAYLIFDEPTYQNISFPAVGSTLPRLAGPLRRDERFAGCALCGLPGFLASNFLRARILDIRVKSGADLVLLRNTLGAISRFKMILQAP